MKLEEVRYLRKMAQMQEELDTEIMRVHKLKKIDEKQLNMATLDEIGELTHELKGNWCWWKFTQPEVNQEKVLGELVDIWHFVLSYLNNCLCFFKRSDISIRDYIKFGSRIENQRLKDYGLAYSLTGMFECFYATRLTTLVVVTEYLGFTVEDVYKAYIKKNKINYKRVEQRY